MLQKLHLPLKGYMDGYFLLSLGEYYFAGFFPGVLTHMGKDLKISKNRFNRYGRQVGSHTNEKNISTVWNVGQVDIGQLGYGTSFVQHFGRSKVLDKQDIDLRHGPI